MSQSHNPKIVRDGLVLALDAASTKNSLNAVEVLVVAGGGGGGAWHGGGGGAGGLIYNSMFSVTPGAAITTTVGNGGSGGIYSSASNGGNGSNSVFGSLTAIGGGGGGTYSNAGNNGGSGGGPTNWSISAIGGTGTIGQGFNGGSNNGQTNNGGGGGGAGGTAKGLSNNSGGDGLLFNISGSAVYYAGGGGAGTYPGYTNDTSYGYGGLGGGGNGGNGPHNGGTAPTAGVANTGGGGGGVADLNQNGAIGGSGIVIVRYKGSQRASGGTVTFVNGYTIHTFTTSGTFTPNGAPGTGTIWTDVSKNGKSATLMNGVGYNSANKGSFVFDGTVGKRATLTYNSTNFVNTNFTWIAWVLGQGSPTVNMPQIGYGTGGWPRLGFYENAGIWYFQQFNIAGPPAISNVSCGASSNTVWKQICCVGNYSSSQILGYNNGSYVAAAAYVDSSGNDSVFGIGRAGTTYEPWNEAFLGNISAIQIYNRALTAAEIKQNFNALRGRFGI